jgi:hypothetical protein
MAERGRSRLDALYHNGTMAVKCGRFPPFSDRYRRHFAGDGQQTDGRLALEPVCERAVTQVDAVASCTAVSTHVFATGRWMLDSDHGWNEIHPLDTLTAGQAGSACRPLRAYVEASAVG